jgi:hypothetical protein
MAAIRVSVIDLNRLLHGATGEQDEIADHRNRLDRVLLCRTRQTLSNQVRLTHTDASFSHMMGVYYGNR